MVWCDHAVVMSGQGDKAEHVHQLELGTARIARDYFRHDPPGSQEIEHAIDFVEDELMRLGKPPDAATTLWSTSPALQAWSAASGPAMPLETVEQWFQRLASASLVLREFMHHRGHASIFVVEASGPKAVAFNVQHDPSART